jgi:hypothetical protein
MDYRPISRPNKEILRRKFFSQVESPAKTYLCLPSLTIKCILEALSVGAIDRSTKIIAFERDKKLAVSVRELLKHMRFNAVVYDQEIERGFIEDEIDLAYLDFCGQINADILLWLTSVNFSENAKVGFTFTRVPRSLPNTFYRRLLNNQIQLPGQTQFVSGTKPDTIALKICEAISYFVPLRWNLTESYKDTQTSMLFLGGYLGKAPKIRVRLAKGTLNVEKLEMIAPTPTEKVINKIRQLAKEGVSHPQQIGGLRIMYNRLTPAQKAWVRRKAAKEMTQLSFN